MFQEVIGDPRSELKKCRPERKERRRLRKLGDFIHKVIPNIGNKVISNIVYD